MVKKVTFKSRVKWASQYLAWRVANPFTPYEKYYTYEVEERKVKAGKPPLFVHGSESGNFSTEVLDTLLSLGLKKDDLVIEYGCGALRQGKAVIEHQNPGKYRALDVTEAFYRIGLASIGDELVAEKSPRCNVISEAVLAEIRAEAPKFVISWVVCMCVPVVRHDDYFGKLLSLVSPSGFGIIDFYETLELRRISNMAWSKPRSMVRDAILRIMPDVRVSFQDLAGSQPGIGRAMAIVRRDGSNNA